MQDEDVLNAVGTGNESFVADLDPQSGAGEVIKKAATINVTAFV